MKNTMTVTERFNKAIKDNRFRMDEELDMLEALVNKYNFKSVSQYARDSDISQPAALKRVSSGKVMFIEMIGRKFIINS